MPPFKFTGDVAHVDHPSLDGRKELLGKALSAIHLEMRDTRGELVAASGTVRLRSRNRAEDDRFTMTDFLADLHKSVADEVAAARSPPAPVTHNRVAEFKAHAARMSCAKCTAAAPCSGSGIDDGVLVAKGGLCLSIFNEMFGALLKLAGDTYARVEPPPAPAAVRVVLRTEVTRRDNAVLGGKTQFPPSDDVGGREAIVTATFPLHAFAQHHMARLPYFLFHEIFVHCPEAWARPGARPHTRESCAFREGFVDAAAASRLERALIGGEIDPTPYPDLRDQFAFATQEAHLVRATAADLPAATVGGPVLTSLRRKGAMAFRAIRQAIGEDAEALACALNVLDTTDAERSRLMSMLEKLASVLPQRLAGATPRIRNLALDVRALLRDRPINPEAVGRLLLAPTDEEEF